MGTQTVEFPVPANRAGVVIGKGGENIRLIKEKSGAFVQIEKNVGDVDKDPNWKTFIIRLVLVQDSWTTTTGPKSYSKIKYFLQWHTNAN